MVLKIHGSLDSTCTQRVLSVLEEKQVAYELVAIDFAKQEHKTAEHVKLQPWGKFQSSKTRTDFYFSVCEGAVTIDEAFLTII